MSLLPGLAKVLPWPVTDVLRCWEPVHMEGARHRRLVSVTLPNRGHFP
jgi:hypothetical protein